MAKRGQLSPVAQDLLQWGVPRLVGAGYGLLSKKAAHPRWPEFIITAFVLKKYRERSSFFFMICHALKGMRRHEVVSGQIHKVLARLVRARPRDLYQLSGIYRGLLAERGAAVATAAVVEIVRISNQKRQQKRRKNESHTHPPRHRRRLTQNRRVARSRTRRA